MWKSIIYKEWLKVRWFAIVYLVMSILAIANLFLKVQHDFTFSEAQKYWYMVMFQNMHYFKHGFFQILPLLGALAIAIAQYFPETVSKRIKLTYHLPLKENKALLIMMFFGTFCMIIISAITVLLFVSLSYIWFPAEIVNGAIITTTPYFLSGFAAYFLTALIVLEPVWKYRLLYTIVAAAFVPIYFNKTIIGGYLPALPLLTVFTIILSISLLFSGYRFRKGEM